MTVTHVLPSTPNDPFKSHAFASFGNHGRPIRLPSPQSDHATGLPTSPSASSNIFEFSPVAASTELPSSPSRPEAHGDGVASQIGGGRGGPSAFGDASSFGAPTAHGMSRPGFRSIGSAADILAGPVPSKPAMASSPPPQPPQPPPPSDKLPSPKPVVPSLHMPTPSAADQPPSTPRRHRSGHHHLSYAASKSRIRDRSKSHIPYSKSTGALMGASLSSWDDRDAESSRNRQRETSIASADGNVLDLGDGSESPEETDVEDHGPYDNSARFYFHHPYAKSASTSPSRTTGSFAYAEPVATPPARDAEDHTPSSSRQVPFAPLGNLLARRNFALSDRAQDQLKLALSPEAGHIELKVRPASPNEVLDQAAGTATAAASSIASDNSALPGANGRLVILTPTTQEWRELGLDNLHDLGGEGIASESDSDPEQRSSPEEERRPSWSSSDEDLEGLGLAHTRSKRETSLGLRLNGPEDHATPQPGGRNVVDVVEDTVEPPSREGARSAPPLLEDTDLWTKLAELKRSQAEGEASMSPPGQQRTGKSGTPSPKLGHNPSLSETIISSTPTPVTLSRSQSMRAPDETHNKKEKARERLFRMVGEEVEKEGGLRESPTGSWVFRQIGSGLGLGEVPASRVEEAANRPSSAPALAHAEPKAATPEAPPGEQPLPAPVPQRLAAKPIAASPLSASVTANSPDPSDSSSLPRSRKSTRTYSRQPSVNVTMDTSSSAQADVEPITSRRRQSQRLSVMAGRTAQPFAFPSVLPPSHPSMHRKNAPTGLASFSPFFPHADAGPPSPKRMPSALALKSPALLGSVGRSDSTLSFAPSIAAPSECGTPQGETVGGVGGGGIDDYIIESEAGKGAYGLVKRAHQKGPDGRPCGEEVIIKYIIKSRILADCWKKHKRLGPIPIEIHVMEQLRNIRYHPPAHPHPWDPARAQTPQAIKSDHAKANLAPPQCANGMSTSPESDGGWHPRLTSDAIKDRGHPNVCKMLDFFEDKEFYYLVMPKFGVGLDLFDRVENAPDGLPPFEIRSLLGQLSDALAFLHANGIVHRDIKDENVILDGEGRCQLIDFGSAAHWRPTRKWDTFSGTLDYASPEILRGEMYGGKEQDVWALGVVGYVLICGETPFLSADEAQAGLFEGSKAERALLERCGGDKAEDGLEADGGGRMGDVRDFVERCLEMQPSDRPPADALLRHRFLIGMNGWTGHLGWMAAEAE